MKKLNSLEISVHTTGSVGSELANCLAVYIPADLRSACKLRTGDRFDVKVVNNKVAIRHHSQGAHVLSTGSCLYIKASLFEPPLYIHESIRIQTFLAQEWLMFQIPKEFEWFHKGFDLLTPEVEVLEPVVNPDVINYVRKLGGMNETL